MIGKLLGHRQVQTTARYAHLAQESVKTSAGRVAESISQDMETPPGDSASLIGYCAKRSLVMEYAK